MKERIQAARDTGFQDGKAARDYCRGNFETGDEWVAWYAGWQAGREAAEQEIVRKGVKPEWARCFYQMERRTA
ncbi:MAG: hypothetical protein ACE15B_19345 [Bryobacteraceae bacterium]